MGEEDKKSAAAAAAEAKKDAPAPAPEEKPKDEKPKEEKAKAEEKGKEGAGEEKAPPPPPPEEVVMRVYMHCEGCARKVKKSLKGFDGVEEVSADSKTHKVVVKGKKAAEDPMKVVARVQKKTGRKVELLSPMPPAKEEKKEEQEKKDEAEPPKSEEKEAPPPVIAVVLKVHMHCEACAQEIKKRILKMKGVQSAEPDLKASQVTVKGVFEAAKLAEYVHKRTGKHAAIVKTEPVASAENAGGEGNGKDEKKAADGGEKKDDKAEKKDGGGAGGEEKGKDKEKDGANAAGEEKDKDLAAATANLYMHYPRLGYTTGYGGAPGGYAYPTYPPQIFSDENPNACAVM